MEKNTIGFFDSGSGGLSVLRAFRALAPQADIVYFGDVKNAPYGTRSASELRALTHQGLAFLKQAGVTHIVAACNSVSPSILALSGDDTPIIEMSLPTARALRTHDGKRLLLLATPATISSGLYENAISEQVILDPLPIPDLAGAIEYGANQDKIRSIMQEAFSSRVGEKYDGIILGCTHYPLVRDVIAEEVLSTFGEVDLIDPADAVATEAVKLFDTEGTGRLTFHISSDTGAFRSHVAKLFPTEPYEVHIVESA